MTAKVRSPRVKIWRETGTLLSSSWSLVRQGGARMFAIVLVAQLAVLGVGIPVIGWLFREALRSAGLTGLDMGQLQVGSSFPLTIALILLIVLLAFWLLSLQFTALVVLMRWPDISGRALLGELGRVARSLVRPRALPMVFYLFLLVPLTGFGFLSAFTRGISLPLFVSGELAKSTPTMIGYIVFLLLLAWLNIRLALTVPVFVLTNGVRAGRASRRLTRGFSRPATLVLAAAALLICASAAGGLLISVAVAPTALADLVAPDGAYVIAAFSLGVAQVAGFLLSGLTTALLAGVLVTATRRWADRLPAGVTLADAAGAPAANEQAEEGRAGSGITIPATPSQPVHHHRSTGLIVTACAAAAAIVLGSFAISTMDRLSHTPESLVLSHRGFSDGGVENTISALEAASKAGADLVEMDVMQTKDGKFVAMHDATLGRLAGLDLAVKDLTFDELTDITVHNLQGFSDKIPSFTDYVTRAHELGMPLLIEIKMSGAETEDHVDLLVEELESLGLLEENMYHSLDAPSVERLKQLRPDLNVGYTMAFAAVDVPDTNADFIVVEEWSASENMQQAATREGLGFMAWTVNDEAGIREHLRRGTDGIISDHPDQVLALREEMQQETGLAGVLFDALTRFVKVV